MWRYHRNFTARISRYGKRRYFSLSGVCFSYSLKTLFQENLLKIIHALEENKGQLYINPKQYFDNVPENIYSFYIGGYMVLDKYLKSRKNRSITLDEIENVEKVVKVIAYTMDTMEEIDIETKEWV